jgi:HTH-type transcriptional regulator/antitoxin HigA
MTSGKDSHLSSWDDFIVGGSSSEISPELMFQDYLKLRSTFDSLPKAELLKRGWIESNDDSALLSTLYREISQGRVNRLFRKTDPLVSPMISLWLSKVSATAERSVLMGSVSEFQGLSKTQLVKWSRLSSNVDSIRELPRILAEYGIVLVYLRALPRMKLDGAVFKLSSGHPVVGVSFRYPRLDNFWFTLMHELAHIVLHEDILDEPILDNLEIEDESKVEASANRLAKTSFVARHLWRNCEPKYTKTKDAILNFAKEQGLHPSIVAGMLQREEGDYRAYSDIVNKVNVRKLVFGDD